MSNKNYSRGRRFEYQVKKDLEQQGFHVLRTAGSHGAYDLIAISNLGLCIKFIQCKTVSKLTSGIKKALLKELKNGSPIKCEYFDSEGNISIYVELMIKEQGKKEYITCPLGVV